MPPSLTKQDTPTPEPTVGILNANISMPVSKPARPIAVVSSKLAKDDKLNKWQQFDQLNMDIQNQRANVQALQSQKLKQQQIQDLTMKTPPNPDRQIEDIIKGLSKEL